MDELITHCCIGGISEWVAAGEVMETPLGSALDCLESVPVWEVEEARSAVAFALGMCKSGGLPIGVALAAPSLTGECMDDIRKLVAEAVRDCRPMLLLTLGTLPGGDPLACCDIKSILLAGGTGMESPLNGWNYDCPIHINLPARDTDATAIHQDRLSECVLHEPSEPVYPAPNTGELARALRFRYATGLVVLIGDIDPDEQDAALWLAEELRAPVVADASSGLREKLDHLSLKGAVNQLRVNSPGIILHMGKTLPSALFPFIEDSGSATVFSIGARKSLPTAGGIHIIPGNIETIIKAMGEVGIVGDPCGYMGQARKRDAQMNELMMSYPDSSLSLLHSLSNDACIADSIYISGSLLPFWNEAAQTTLPCEYIFTCHEKLPNAVAVALGTSVWADNAWSIMTHREFTDSAKDLAIDSLFRDGRRVIVLLDRQSPGSASVETIEDICREYQARHITIRSSFDLDAMDQINSDGLWVIDIIHDAEQSRIVDQKLAQL